MIDEIMIKNKKLFLALFFLLALAFLCLFFGNYSIHGNKLENIKINGNDFKIEVVNSSLKIDKGLGERARICEKCGMLFDFPKKGRQSFWMKGMKFDLDMIWINDNKVVYIAKNIPYDSLETITPEVEAGRVLEINAGLSDRLGIEVGSEVEWR